MHILIEEHKYPAETVHKILDGITSLRDIDGMISVNYVGYFYNPTLKDCVFILPKVLLEDVDGQELVFGHANPEDIVNLEITEQLTQIEHDFIYELSVWIYRAIAVYRDNAIDSTIIKQQNLLQMGNGRLRQCNTFLDILLALQRFNRENQDFFFYVLRNMHSGFNKINWTRTISHSSAIVQEGHPIYPNPINKKRRINFDEELFVIFFSILHYIHDIYGFPVKININFPLITGEKFKSYLSGMGRTRMLQIKYKYFSDKALYLWELCFAFFDQSRKINVEKDIKEYLLSKNFNIVFEAIIDELIGDKNLPKELKDQGDGKRVDHMYQYRELTNDLIEKPIYYIGDSKYYKRNTELGKEAVFKQFTYARNVIQWNIDLFNDASKEEQEGHIKLRDDVTEGYNIIPNFFISAQQITLKRDDNIQLTDKERKYFQSRHFENRLFDRDTFLIAHYNVNFLFVVALYGRNNATEKKRWKVKVREMFRREIQGMLEKNFSFYAMTAHENVEANTYIKENFQMLLGKVFQPFEDLGNQQYFSLALRNPDKIELKDKKKEQQLKALIKEENEQVMFQLKQAFYVEECSLGASPYSLLPTVQPHPHIEVPHNLLTRHYVQNYPDTIFLIGGFREEQKAWMFGQKGGKTDYAYNVRLGVDVEGGLNIRETQNIQAKFVILYEYNRENAGVYKAFRVKGYQVKTKNELIKEGYISPHYERYYCYVFDEEVNLGMFNVEKIISSDRIDYASEIHQSKSLTKKYPEGRPIFLKGSELMKFIQ